MKSFSLYSIYAVLLLLALSASAQTSSDFRSEQIAINLHKMAVLPGDTMEIEGQVTCIAADRFLPYSNYVYLECISEADSVLSRQKVSCKEKGYFSTRLPIDYDWFPGVYYIRAYTRMMMNFPVSGFPIHPFLVSKLFPEKENFLRSLRCDIHVVGGTFLANQLQRLSVFLQDQSGFPVSMPLYLMRENSKDTLATVHTSSSGLGMLHFIPKSSARYYLLSGDGRDRFPLPAVKESGVQIHGDLKGVRLSYRIQGEPEQLPFRICTYDRLNGLVEYDIDKRSGIILLEKEPCLVSLFLLDNDGMKLSECTLYSPRSRDFFSINVSDSLALGDTLQYALPQTDSLHRVLVRVVSENEPVFPMEAELYYLSDYQSDFPFPVAAFSHSGGDSRNDLYAWASSAHFKSFDLAEAARVKTQAYRYIPETNLTFSGKVAFRNDRPLADGTLVAYHTEKDFVYDVPTDKNGRFLMAVDDFMEGESFYLQAQTAKGALDFYQYQVDSDTFPAVENISRYRLLEQRYSVHTDWESNLKELSVENGNRHYLMPGVEVKARLKTDPPKPTNQFYKTNFVDREEIEGHAYQTLYEILRSMPGITVTSDGSITSTRGASTLGGGGLIILMDGARIYSSGSSDDAGDHGSHFLMNLMQMSSFEIESVELLRPWQTNAYVSGAIGGALYIKTRNVSKKREVKSKGVYYTPLGLFPLSNQPLKATSWVAKKTGRYRLIIDVVSAKEVCSYVYPFTVGSSVE